ncbi:MAG: hypothetical protein Q4C48_06625 [Lachnospiraceae bacterium]|nr:hypothetical protein [Lachnospiraceae bacterium]
MKKMLFLIIFFCTCFLAACSSEREEGGPSDETDAEIASQGDYVYYISRKGFLCCFTLSNGVSQVVSETTGSVRQTPWGCLFIQGRQIGRLEDGTLRSWLTLPEGTVFAAATEDGCYSIKERKEEDGAEVYYTTEGAERLVTVLDLPQENVSLLRLYPAGEGFYYDDGTALYYRRGETERLVETALLQSVCQGREGIAYLTAADDRESEPSPEDGMDARVCSLHYVSPNGSEVLSEQLSAEGLFYAEGRFVTVGARAYGFSEEQPQAELLTLTRERSYTVSKSCMNEKGLVSRIAYEDRFCYQSDTQERVYDFSGE